MISLELEIGQSALIGEHTVTIIDIQSDNVIFRIDGRHESDFAFPISAAETLAVPR
ncbi:MAG: hypothetical protein KDA78_03415 [Planctomycetaceae bacterium]|nr:hypothetical protein [Planctomycetaceae bacterium]